MRTNFKGLTGDRYAYFKGELRRLRSAYARAAARLEAFDGPWEPEGQALWEAREAARHAVFACQMAVTAEIDAARDERFRAALAALEA